MPTSAIPFLPSVLDRLLDAESLPAPEREASRSQQLSQLRVAVRRDLEALLNTHHPWRSPPADMPHLRLSLLDYGIPDFFAANAGAAAARESFRSAIEEIIRRFEPRFKMVAVSLPEGGGAEDRTLRFHIEALMLVEPAPERVSFDSTLDPSNHSFSVGGGRDG